MSLDVELILEIALGVVLGGIILAALKEAGDAFFKSPWAIGLTYLGCSSVIIAIVPGVLVGLLVWFVSRDFDLATKVFFWVAGGCWLVFTVIMIHGEIANRRELRELEKEKREGRE